MELTTTETDQLTPLVARVLDIEQVTWGNREMNFVVRYRGQLQQDSQQAHDQLSAELKAHGLTPLFREEENTQAVILVKGFPEPTPSNPWVNLVLFILTLFSMLLAGTIYSYDGPVPGNPLLLIKTLFLNLEIGMPFGLSLLGILLAHEFGHYLAGRYHKTAVTLPYFIPFPLSPFGTMGAFIQLKEPPKNKRILHDIGIAGPLAGLVVAIPILLIGLSLSTVEEFPLFVHTGESLSMEGNSLFYLFAKYLVHGELLPAPSTYGAVSPLIYWVKYLVTGLPTPMGGRDVFLHPMAWAGWAGLLVTALNLIPAGQLDGGHIMYVLFGKRAKKLLPVILVTLSLLGFAWPGWWIWVFLIFFLGRQHAEPLDQITQLDNKRRVLSILALIIFVLIFTPVPLRLITGPFVGP